LQRFVTPGAGETGSSPYTLGGNDPLNRGPKIDWASLKGPDAYSNSWNRDIGSLVHSIVGDRLAYASDTQLFLGTALFSTGVAIVGKFALPYAAMGAKAIAPALPYIAYASAGYNAARVIGSGGDHGKLDLAADLLGVGLLSKARQGTRLARMLWYAADAGINTAQGSRNVWESQRAFSNGDVLGGSLNAIGAGLSFAGALGSSRELWAWYHATPRIPGMGAAAIADESFANGRLYKLNDKHGVKPRYENGVFIGARPTNGQQALDKSIPLPGDRRIVYDVEAEEIVILPRDSDWWDRDAKGIPYQQGGIYHGYVVPWNLLRPNQRAVLIEANIFNNGGKYIGPG